MANIKNIIFDFDGTLADTSKLIVATMQKTIIDYGLPFKNEEEIKATIGLRLEEIPKILWPRLKNLGVSFAAVYRRNFEELKDQIPINLFSGVKETLVLLKERDCKMAIATSRSNNSVVELTEKLGIKERFDKLLGGDNVAEGKPNPDSIYKIMNEMNWNFSETMMVGDMTVDIIMGKNAGIKTCGVTYGNGKVLDLKEAGSDFIISDFSDLINIMQC